MEGLTREENLDRSTPSGIPYILGMAAPTKLSHRVEAKSPVRRRWKPGPVQTKWQPSPRRPYGHCGGAYTVPDTDPQWNHQIMLLIEVDGTI